MIITMKEAVYRSSEEKKSYSRVSNRSDILSGLIIASNHN